MKKIIIIVSIVLGLLLLGVIALPFVVDVDQYRPTLLQFVNSKLNGRFELGKLKLSLWGELAVEADKALLEDSNQMEVLSVDKFKLTIPLKTVLAMRPEIRVVMKHPKVQVSRNKQGVWNVMSLTKREEPQPNKIESSPTPPPSPPPMPQKSPEIKEAAAPAKALPPWAEKAVVSILIEEATFKIDDLKSESQYEFDHLNLSTGRVSLDSLPEFKLTGVLAEKGPFEVRGQGKDSALSIEAHFDKMGLALGRFEKKAGNPARIYATVSKKDDKYFCEGKLEPVKIRGDELKQELEVSGRWKVSTDRLEKFTVTLQAKGFDLNLTSHVDSFEKPKIIASIDSNEMDLDQLFDWEKFQSASKSSPKVQPQASPLATPTAAPTAAKPTVAVTAKPSSSKSGGATGEINIRIGLLKAYKTALESIHGKMNLKDQKVSGAVDNVKVLGGKVKSAFIADLSSGTPKYEFQCQVADLNLAEAVASRMELFKNTVTGLLSGELSGKTEGLDANSAKKNLDATGKIRVAPAKLMTVDINRMLSESLAGVISKVADKVPALKGKDVKPPAVSSEFQKVTATFSIKGGEFNSSDFFAEAIPQKGVDIRGSTRVGLLDFSLKADWEVADTYNLLRVDPLLIERGKPFRIPIRVEGTLLSPKYDYLEIPEALAKVALNNVGAAVKQKAEQEIKKQAEEKVKSILKGIFK